MVDVQSLKSVPVFSELDADALQFLAQHVAVRELQAGDVVCRERDVGDSLFVVESGELAISKVIDWDDMTEKVLATVGAGTFFGEMSLLDNEPRSATVKAISACKLLVVKRDNFIALLAQSSLAASKLLLAIIQTINRRLRQTNLQLVTLYDTGKIIGSVKDLSSLVESIMERITEALDVEKGLLLLLNPYSGELEVKQATGYSEDERQAFDLSLDRGVLGTVFQDRSPVKHEGPIEGLGALAGFETRSMLLAPLINNEVLIGAVMIGDKRSGAAFSNDDANLLAGVATQVATAVENARMIEEREAKERHDRVYITY